jgi:hypothetical protein
MLAQRLEHPSRPWILANAAGFAVGGAIAGAVVLTAEEPLVGTVQSQTEAAAALAPITLVSLGVFGALVGLLQWLVLRRQFSMTAWWIAGTAGGWAGAGAVAGALSGFIGGTVTGVGPGIGVLGYLLGTVGGVAALGILPGLLQSLVLRPRVGALRWSAAHLAALGAGFLVAFPVMLVVAELFGFSLPSAQAWAIAGLLMGTVFGMVTWRVLDGAVVTQPRARAASDRPSDATG